MPTGTNVNADAESRHACLKWPVVAQLVPIEPHGLLVLLMPGKTTQNLMAGSQSRRAIFRDGCQVAAERTRDFALLRVHGDGHEA